MIKKLLGSKIFLPGLVAIILGIVFIGIIGGNQEKTTVCLSAKPPGQIVTLVYGNGAFDVRQTAEKDSSLYYCLTTKIPKNVSFEIAAVVPDDTSVIIKTAKDQWWGKIEDWHTLNFMITENGNITFKGL